MEKKAVLKKRSAEETKLIPAIYDDEASAASAAPSTSGYFPLSKRAPGKAIPKTAQTSWGPANLCPFRITNAGEVFLLWQSASRHILVFAAGSNIKMLAARRTWGMLGNFKFLLTKSDASPAESRKYIWFLSQRFSTCLFISSLQPAYNVEAIFS
ncbi:hypothetical protein Tsp_09808 [Trichinella spiralis]|uniref:hypothetical protein n=1 Tax=Trichinella spiralis TaxID=6334 RepID=UPI0001EFD7EB|nr:hypothetical protein Tsp_09808 [Trichinella spiralis]